MILRYISKRRRARFKFSFYSPNSKSYQWNVGSHPPGHRLVFLLLFGPKSFSPETNFILSLCPSGEVQDRRILYPLTLCYSQDVGLGSEEGRLPSRRGGLPLHPLPHRAMVHCEYSHNFKSIHCQRLSEIGFDWGQRGNVINEPCR